MSEALLEAVALAVELGGRRILDGVSLRAEAHQVIAVVGPNGAGKTTLLRALAGLIAATGELRVAGHDPRQDSAEANARRRAYCAQKPGCAWDYRVRDLGEIINSPEAFAERLHKFGLNDLADRRLTRLSGGEQKAAHLAMAFASLVEPFGAVLLLDEPADSLDITRQALAADAIRRFAQAGGAAVVATHDLGFARSCDVVIVMAEGRLIAAGAPPATLTPDVITSTWGA